MTAPRSKFKSDSAAPVTGVASVGLGTGANLEDTQVFPTEDLAAPAANTPEPVAATAAPPASPEPAHAEPEPAPVQPARPLPSAPIASAPVSPVVAARSGRGSPNRQPGRGLTGLLAAALVVLAGVAFVVASNDGTFGAGESVPSAGAPATAAPDANAGAGDGDRPGGGNDRGEGNDRDKDKDRDKPCQGNGNGRGCGGGDDDDDD
jgi:hypothetical protein